MCKLRVIVWLALSAHSIPVHKPGRTRILQRDEETLTLIESRGPHNPPTLACTSHNPCVMGPLQPRRYLRPAPRLTNRRRPRSLETVSLAPLFAASTSDHDCHSERNLKSTQQSNPFSLFNIISNFVYETTAVAMSNRQLSRDMQTEFQARVRSIPSPALR